MTPLTSISSDPLGEFLFLNPAALALQVSDQISRSVVSDSLQPHESQHARPPCPSPTPGVHRDSRPLSQWCHPAIWSSVVPFSSCPQSLPASGSFPMNQLFAWGGQRTGVSALASRRGQYHQETQNPVTLTYGCCSGPCDKRTAGKKGKVGVIRAEATQWHRKEYLVLRSSMPHVNDSKWTSAVARLSKTADLGTNTSGTMSRVSSPAC